MAEKNIKSRIIHKHDVEANWILATNFTPQKGELIVYDIDDNYTYERIKMGDGVQNVNDLPFVDEALRTELLAQIDDIDEKVDAVSTLVGDTSVSDQINEALLSSQSNWTQNDSTAVDYIENRPFYDSIKSNLIYVSSSNQPTATTFSDGLYYGTTTGSSTTIQNGSKYKITINIDGYSSTIFTCTRAKLAGADQYCNVLGNAKLGVDIGFLDGNNSSYPITDTGEDFCFLSYSSTAKNAIISTHQSARITAFYTVTGELKQIDEKFIPDTIARTSDISDVLDGFESGMALQGNTIELPDSDSWMSIAYGNGKFVAVSSESDVAAYSTDGAHWTATTMPRSGAWHSVIYANGKFVAVCAQYGASQAAYSTDGINWTMSNLSLSNGANSYESYAFVAYGNGKFVVVSDSSGNAAYSTDGITWTDCTTPPNIACKAVTYGNGVFVAVPTHGDTACYSADGVVWESTTVPTASYHNIVYGDGKFVATYLDANTAVLNVMYSTDGINWSSKTIGSNTSYYNGICYGNGKFVAVATNGSGVIYSDDGTTWSSSNTIGGNHWYSMCYDGNKFVAVAWHGQVAYSSDGITWSDQYYVISQDGADVTADTIVALAHTHNDYMEKSVYDPQNKSTDVFAYIDDKVSDINVTIDSELSDTSKNAVQNKVVNAAISNLNALVGDTSVSEQIAEATYTQTQVNELIAAVREFCLPKVRSITLSENNWVFSANYYYQDVAVGVCTPTCKVDLQPTYAQLATWQDDGLAFTTQSKDGIVRVWAVPEAPREDITVQISVQEVMEV